MKDKLESESTMIHSESPGTYLYQFVTAYGNPVSVNLFGIDVRGSRILNDRNAKTYSVQFCSDFLHAMIMVENPHALQILNLSTGEMFIARGQDELRSVKVLTVSVQPKDPNNAKKTRKIYIIYEHMGSIFIKIVQV